MGNCLDTSLSARVASTWGISHKGQQVEGHQIWLEKKLSFSDDTAATMEGLVCRLLGSLGLGNYSGSSGEGHRQSHTWSPLPLTQFCPPCPRGERAAPARVKLTTHCDLQVYADSAVSARMVRAYHFYVTCLTTCWQHLCGRYTHIICSGRFRFAPLAI